jgi:hypothetical protein
MMKKRKERKKKNGKKKRLNAQKRQIGESKKPLGGLQTDLLQAKQPQDDYFDIEHATKRKHGKLNIDEDLSLELHYELLLKCAEIQARKEENDRQ